jgi:DNA-binding transcriptional regulator LsrR (DeoR family)
MSDHARLLVKVARLYYEQELTQADIGQRLRLSRQKVQRLLSQARAEGIVQINVNPIMGTFADVETALAERFELQEAIVVETTAYDDQLVVAREVGAGAAEYLLRIVEPNDVIVMSWGGSLLGMVNGVAANRRREDLRGVTVIQGLGSLGDPNNDTHASDLTRRLARSLNGQAVLLPAPGAAGSPTTRDAFYNDPHVSQVLQTACAATMMFTGIGAPRPDSILVREGNIVTWPELATLMEQGAVGDLNLRYFDEYGRKFSCNLDDRVIGLDLDQVQSISLVVGVAGGLAKFRAIKAALRGKLVDVLVTDHVTATQLLEGKQN